jgi:osmotically-inducible protein OsmY
MRRYDREDVRRLNDGERYRDYDYLADDAWIGPNERVPHGFTTADAPPWSTLGDYEARPFAAERAFDEDRGQGRDYGRDLGLGYGRPHDERRSFERSETDDYDRGYARPDPGGVQRYARRTAGEGHGRPPYWERGAVGQDEHAERAGGRGRRVMGAVYDAVRHPLDTVRNPMERLRQVRGAFRGKGPKNWVRADDRIRDEVCERLADHPEIDAADLEVTVSEGEVTLQGDVHDRRMKYLVEDVADDVLGVRDVHNRLQIRRTTDPEARGSTQLSGSQGTSANSTTAAVRR